jgi:hypothetical protein
LLTVAASDAYNGRAIDAMAVIRRALARTASTLIAGIIKYTMIFSYCALCVGAYLLMAAQGAPQVIGGELFAAVVITFLGLAVGGALYLQAVFFAVTPAVTLEGKGPVEGLRRSLQLSRHLRRHVLGGLALVYTVYFLALTSIASLPDGWAAAGYGLFFGLTILISPTLSATRVMLYYDARIRIEGYDLDQLLARSASVASSLASKP